MNSPEKPKKSDKPEKAEFLIQQLQDLHLDYLRDESRTSGKAETISFPKSEAEVQSIVKILVKQKTPFTIQGSRTGITGGAVPMHGHVMNLSKMARVTGLEKDQDNNFFIRVQPGLSLSELNQQIETNRFDMDGWDQNSLEMLGTFKKSDPLFWPPDPSEESASIGGIAANNSRGICAHRYGSANSHIKAIQVVDTHGEIHSITRGQYVFSQGICPLPGGKKIKVDLTGPEPGSLDNPLGMYDLKTPPWDLMDLYLGSEGMLGVITELTLSLQPLPKEIWGIVFFFGALSQAIDFIQALDPAQTDTAQTDTVQTDTIQTGTIQTDPVQTVQNPVKTKDPHTHMVAIEFMDQTTLECIREYKKTNSQLREIPNWDTSLTTAVYIEIHGSSAENVEELSLELLATAGLWGNDPDDTWAFCGKAEIERLRLFRHAAPESVNQIIDRARQIDPRITKLGTDMALENTSLSEIIEMYSRDLKAHGLKAAIFGHAADKHLHVNILPKNYPQFIKARTVIENWAKIIHGKKGSVVTEHGVGKIKKNLFLSTPLPRRLELLCKVKQQLDPLGLWNPDNITDSIIHGKQQTGEQQTKTINGKQE